MVSPPRLIAGLALIAANPVIAAIPAPPTGLAAVSSSIGSLELTWVDNAVNEESYRVEFSFDGGPFTFIGSLEPDSQSVNLTLNGRGKIYGLRLAAENEDGISAYSNEVIYLPRAFQIAGGSQFSGVAGEPFSQTFVLIDPSTGDTFPATSDDLPPGLSIDPATGTVSGTLQGGQYTGFSVSPADPLYAEKLNVVLDVKAAPLATAVTEVDIFAGATTEVDLDRFFEDPDTGSTVQFSTSEGMVNVGLFDGAAPLTVANFFAYADSGAWDNTFFHRAAKLANGDRFVNQGGGYRPLGDGTFETIPDFPPVPNEFSRTRPNGKGTISMAKIGGLPDSATNEWFFSLEDNRSILDDQNGGFTVFGKVLGEGLGVLHTINDLPRGTYNPPFDGVPRTFADWPLREGFSSPTEPGALVSVTGVRRIAPLTYSTTTPGATITGPTARVTASGETVLTVTATDLDGLATTAQIALNTVTTPTGFPTFAASFGIPADPEFNLDGDALPALLEFATGGDPTTTESGRLVFSRAGLAPTLTFPFRHSFSGLAASVEISTDGATWSESWTSSGGLGPGGNLLSATPGEMGLVVLTVSSGKLLSSEPRQLMRLRITLG